MYYPGTVNVPPIYGPTFCDIEVWFGIRVINTTTENYTWDDKYAYDDEEYADISDLTAKPKIEC